MLGLIVFVFCSLAGPVLIFGPLASLTQEFWARLLLFAGITLAGGLALWVWVPKVEPHHSLDRWWKCVVVATLLQTCVYVLISQLPEISTYPLTMGWSETSRYYNASLFFSQRIYGISTPPTVLHPSRYLMQAVPFLIPDAPLWLHRAWQVFLWMATPLLTAIILVRRLLPWKRLETWLLIGVSFVYLTIGPVYYHLLVPVMLVLWGFRTGSAQPSAGGLPGRWRLLISTLVLLLASAWAGISRLNWFPVPGMLAAAIILLERPLSLPADRQSETDVHPSWHQVLVYVLRLAGWVLLGTATALAAQALYIYWSGNHASQFTTSFTSDLLWRRLLPNASYPPGLLLAAFFVTLPVLLVILGKLVDEKSGAAFWRRTHWLRWLGLAGELVVLLVGGTIVSVKIGGGSNLHNLDAYLVLLLVIGVYFYLDRVASDFSSVPNVDQPGWMTQKISPQTFVNAGAILMVLISAFFTVYARIPPTPLPDRAQVQANLDQVIKLAQKTSQNGGEVLFLTDRHLLTFGMLENVRLIPEYERVFLMEAAMSNAQPYLGQFYRDLENQRYAMIISEPLSTQYKSPLDSFGSENNAWVRRVSQQVLCYYYPLATLRKVQMQILMPRVNIRKSCPAN
jgi:hypothetical protein